MNVTFEAVKQSQEIQTYITQADASLLALGYTEHSFAHVGRCAKVAGDLLQDLDYDGTTVELCRIAAYMHDIGNVVNRNDHAHSGGILAYGILKEMGMDLKDAAVIAGAIGHHDEATGTAVDVVSAALILADKTDVRRNRVRNHVKASFDKHDRVNYAAVSAELCVLTEKKTVQLDLELDEDICSILDYFEIFLQRMLMCKRAAEVLGLKFRMHANGYKMC